MTAPSTMTAIVQDRYGEADELHLERVPVPEPRTGEVRVRVRAVSLNPADKYVMRGEPRMFRMIFGLGRPKVRVRGQDLAGTVDAVGDGVTEFKVGDDVYGAFDGALAEYACGPVGRIAPMPAPLSYEEAAALPMAALAARAGLRAGEVGEGTRLLINGASGGIGTCAIQMARAKGAHVTAVCSTKNVDLVTRLGAQHVVDYLQTDLLEIPERFDVILDNVANHRLTDLLGLLDGRGTLLPNSGEPGPDGIVLTRLLKGQWYNLFSKHRVMMFTSEPHREGLEEISALVAAGTLRPQIDTLFSFDHPADAMARLATGHARGKVVVTVT